MQIRGNEDLRVQKTIAAIHDTFSELLLKKDYDKITVKLLCDCAKINKKTFYRYYETMDELLAERLESLSRAFLERIADYHVPDDLALVNREFYRYALEQGELYERLVCSASHRAISGKMLGEIINRTWNTSASFLKLDKYEQNLLLVFINSIGVELYRQWVADGKKMPLETVISLSGALLCNGVNGYMETAKN